MQQAVLVLFVVRELGIAPSWLGILLSVSGIAGIAGALLVGRLTKRFGSGPALIVGQLGWALAALLLPLVGGPLVVALSLLLVSQAVSGIGTMVVRVNQLTVRQALVPDQLLGRTNAIRRVLVFGIIPLGAFLGGLLGELTSLRTTLVAGALCMLLAFVWLARSPVRTLHNTELLSA